MSTVTTDVWVRPDVAELLPNLREYDRIDHSGNGYLNAALVGRIEGILGDRYWTAEEKHQRTIATLAAANAVRAERAEAKR